MNRPRVGGAASADRLSRAPVPATRPLFPPAPATRPLVFAHRGASADFPEHTLEAYEAALAQGADGLECDVRLSRDGHLVCVHDRRLERTSNGHGRVSDYTLDELTELDFGSWHPRGVPAGVLTLERLLSELHTCRRPVRLLIEAKHPNRFGAQLERQLVQLLHKHRLAAPAPDHSVQVTVMSFSALALRRIRMLAPALPTVHLFQLLPPRSRSIGQLPYGARIAGPALALVRSRPHLVPALRAAGNDVYVWTVNAHADVELLRRRRVTGIITDYPAPTLAQLTS